MTTTTTVIIMGIKIIIIFITTTRLKFFFFIFIFFSLFIYLQEVLKPSSKYPPKIFMICSCLILARSYLFQDSLTSLSVTAAVTSDKNKLRLKY